MYRFIVGVVLTYNIYLSFHNVSLKYNTVFLCTGIHIDTQITIYSTRLVADC